MGIYIKLGKILLGDETKKIISLKNLLFASHLKSLYFFSTAAAHFRDKVILWGSEQEIPLFFRFLVPTVIAQAYKAVLRVLPQLSEFHFIPFYFSNKFDFFFSITICDQKIAFYAFKQLAESIFHEKKAQKDVYYLTLEISCTFALFWC